MPTYPPAALPQPVAKDLVEGMDALAYLLATDDRTSGIQWILGDPGMGSPAALPFGYISNMTESVRWMTANGGMGGLGAGGSSGLDDWDAVITLTVCFVKHDFVAPIVAQPPTNSPYNPTQLGGAPPFFEQPTWRVSQVTTQTIKAVLRQNIVVGGEFATMRLTESRPMLQAINGVIYRAIRLTLQTQQRRVRGT